MDERKIIKAKTNVKKEVKEKKPISREVSLDAQELLVEILNDSPHFVSLNGTEWEVRTLRFGTQYLIAQEVVRINKIEQGAGYADVLKQFAQDIPAMVRILTLCLLNDKNRIFKDGIESQGYSEEFMLVYDCLMWEGNFEGYGVLLLECLKMLDISAFSQALDIVQIFRAGVTARKTTKMMDGQK
jgi:hypothetical protein